MKLDNPVIIPHFSDDFMEQYEREMKWLDKLEDVIKFPVADGYAYYLVDGNVIRHIPVGDGYSVHPALIRGLTRDEVDAMLTSHRVLKSVLGR